MDILIGGGKWGIGIENKPWAGEQKEQLQYYADDLERRFCDQTRTPASPSLHAAGPGSVLERRPSWLRNSVAEPVIALWLVRREHKG